jgi:hypothetical protein
LHQIAEAILLFGDDEEPAQQVLNDALGSETQRCAQDRGRCLTLSERTTASWPWVWSRRRLIRVAAQRITRVVTRANNTTKTM